MRTTDGTGLAGLVLTALMLAGAPAALAAQAGGGADGGALPAEREMADAPRQFRISTLASGLLWEDPETVPRRTPEDGTLWGVDVERLLIPWISARLSGAVGTSSLPRPDEEDLDLVQYLAALHLVGRLPLPPLARRGVVPFGTVGIGALIQDPDQAGLTTRSQNAFSFGGGVEFQPFERFGFRAEWRHLTVDLEDIFAATDREGENSEADRILGTVFFTF